jgi:uncharacterized pyridoxamine 5'-phosphate oxidase family protein
MVTLSSDIIHFLQRQGFVVVSTIDAQGNIHSVAKGIVGFEQSKIYIIDLYRAHTYKNLQRNPTISITAIDEHQFIGYTFKGKAEIISQDKIEKNIIKKWEQRVVSRISERVVKSVKQDKTAPHQPEALFPYPQYLIVMSVEEIVDLAPRHLKKSKE